MSHVWNPTNNDEYRHIVLLSYWVYSKPSWSNLILLFSDCGLTFRKKRDVKVK